MNKLPLAKLSRAAFLTLLLLLAWASPASAQFNAFKPPSASGSTTGISGPDLKADKDKVEGGKITIGATAYIVVLFKNTGTSVVKITGINLYPSSTVSAAVSLNKCADAPLSPDGECAVTVAVTGLQPGSWRVEMLLDHDGRSRLATTAITGDVENAAVQQKDEVKTEIDAEPSSLDFGSASGVVPLIRSVLLRNRTADKGDDLLDQAQRLRAVRLQL